MGRRRRWVNGFLDVGVWLLFFGLLVPAALVGYYVGHSGKQQEKIVTRTPAQAAAVLIAPAPAFSSDDLGAVPADDWITNGGSTWNERYSPLDADRHRQRQAAEGRLADAPARARRWRPSTRPRAQPLVYKGVIYVPTGADDVFAVLASTGEILWEYKGDLDQTISTVCCGWDNRGVALGDGRVYVGRLDGTLVALDQRTGKPAWKTTVVPVAAGRHDHRPPRSTTTGSCSPASPAASSASAGASPPTTRRPARSAGASTRFPAPARRATIRGRPATTRGSTAARRSGRRRRSIRSSA